ncbi:pitrilysin family protein [Mucilaginibacter sp. SG564]|uniref:M16 family metallopeptidase n=1 Tax=Mucilaginibacter sp. SG564 TaxID=2587022 RepID=UPI001554D5E1|nr:insulinase family protein [Mucilaginibacter sp. SG564]NOW95039.1 zinc protease [Mucilaginibacter sp. SG564]
MFTKKLLLFAISGLIFLTARSQTLPLDPLVRTGKLPNGFTYYIRHNEQPGKHVELYLVNKVGSILEDEDQLGLAHFMEHMNFNGTKHYPKNNLVDYLQRSGVRFGADLNAYTSFDETVYQLPLSTDDPLMFGEGIKIMRDWAQEATLDPSEIEKERGVILEEERLGKGARDRMSRKYFPILLNHARYAERLPIGTDEVLTKFSPEVIKRFHHDWYRPDLQALIIVGDVKVEEAEKLVKDLFSDLKNPFKERERTRYTVPLTGKSQFITVTDKEETSTTLEVMLKHRSRTLATEQDYLASIKTALLNELLNNRRYAELNRDTAPAYTGVNLGIGSLLSNVDMLSFSVSSKEGMLAQSFVQAWRVLERIRRYGFTQAEFERARQNYLRNMQASANEQGKTPSISYVKEYQRLFLAGEASPGIAWEYGFTKKHIGDIKLPDIAALLNEYLSSKDKDILVSAPEKDKGALPDSIAVQSWMAKIAKEELRPYQDEQVNMSLLSAKPRSGRVTSRKEIDGIGVTELILSNGVRVVLKPTSFKNDQILYGAFAPGGTSLYDDSDFDAASNAGGIIARMGLGGLTPNQLSQVLTGKVVSSAAMIAPRSQTISAGCSAADLETALQITYLQFTSARKDTLLFKNTVSTAVAGLANRYADPNAVFADTVSYVLGNYSYRAGPPTATRLNKIKLDRVYDIYRDRFSDASQFTFVFVGNFDVKRITPLLEQYIGSLPSLHKVVQARDLGIHIPAGIITKKVYKGTEDKALVRMVFSGDYQYSPVDNLKMKALSEILQIKMLQQLREAESEVYSPQVQSSYNKYPQNRFAIVVSFGSAPKNVGHLVNVVEQELAFLRDNGPEADDVLKFKAQYKKNVELAMKDNGFWLGYLLGQYENHEDILQALDTEKNLGMIDAESLKQAAQNFLSGHNMITFELLPESDAR